MTFIKTPPGDTVIKRPGFGTSVRMQKLPQLSSPTQATIAPGTGARDITVFIDTVNSGLLPQDVNEIYLTSDLDCTALLSHDGVIPVAMGDFESGNLTNCLDTPVTLNGGDLIGSIPSCQTGVDITIECRPIDPDDGGSRVVPWVVVRDADSNEVAAAHLDALLPPIPVHLNTGYLIDVSHCSTQIDIDVAGSCTYNEELLICEGSATVAVDDGVGNSDVGSVTCP